jgi:predicted GNAT superfamily acetyltransferase
MHRTPPIPSPAGRTQVLADGTVLRPLATLDERADAVRLQEETWGIGFTERVPAAILMVGQKIGGVSAGAFEPPGRGDGLIGFVFGLTGVKAGRLVHWSDMLAVRSEAQGRGLGEALKHYQRDCCRDLGVETMYWTFDPFVARNARLNLNRLGAGVDEFVQDMYGTQTKSRVHGALGTDRFVATWPVSTDPVPMPDDPRLLDAAVAVAGPPGEALGPEAELPNAPTVAVRIPGDYHGLLDRDIDLARTWRMSARRAFLHYFSIGYRITAFVPHPSGDAAYLLTPPA